MNLAKFPRHRFGHFPTPLEHLKNLSEHLGGPDIYIKRDDCTGLATGGNKTRKLEFLIADALRQGADTVITQGATQSNHVRQTIAAANIVGLKSKAILESRVTNLDQEYAESGNVFLDRLLGGEIASRVPAGTDMNAAMETLAAELRSQGAKPYIIPGGGSNPVGALGYVACGLEIMQQAYELGLDVAAVFHGTGSTGTQAGLIAAFEGTQSGIPVIGISVRAPQAPQVANVLKLANATAELLGLSTRIAESAVQVDDRYVGPGYGQPTPSMIEAVTMLAQREGILLDPVYSGKGMAGLIGQIREGRYRKGQKVVFVHTGGSAALFGYRSVF
ncbi:L-cysteate sulfo-lyase [Pigmentiphaga humi]|uniref:L-cysteate sulfo-lyase n=1 Tax=Pigmentiphaga humi TaxID=2478468 RepID=A0A3P4B526_9BURK|nr:D-cysteine desulfhydrase [Pigmentiphaga humi]VCU71399.1 L-cysteate sulfo-lyase [Pigmentiphaga humi]